MGWGGSDQQLVYRLQYICPVVTNHQFLDWLNGMPLHLQAGSKSSASATWNLNLKGLTEQLPLPERCLSGGSKASLEAALHPRGAGAIQQACESVRYRQCRTRPLLGLAFERRDTCEG